MLNISSRKLASLLSLALLLPSTNLAQSIDRKHVDEMGLWGAQPKTTATEKNIFAGAKVTASPHWDKDVPAKAIDGKVEAKSYWGAEKIPVFYQIDMGSPQDISRIQIWPYWEDGRIYQYKIEGSNDGKNWKMLVDQRANSIAGTASGNEYTFTPQKLRYVRVTFTRNSNGNAQGGHLVEIKGFASAEGGSMLVRAYDDLVRLPWTGEVTEPTLPQNTIRLTAWRGERVNAQILVSGEAALSQIMTSVKSPANKAGKNLPLTAQFVKFTRGHGEPRADIISNKANERLSDKAGINRSIWVSVDIPRDASTGVYKGSVSVKAHGEKTQSVPVEIRVISPTLKKPEDWTAHIDLWQYPDAVARVHGVEVWSDEHFAIMKPLMKRLADAGQKVITASLMHEAWGGQCYDPFPSMVEWIRKPDGTYTWDYTIFDKWVSFMINEVGIKDQISCYTMIPWSLKLRVLDQKTGFYEEVACNPTSPDYEKLWGPFLVDFSKHLEKKGWMDIACIGIDERPDHMLRAANAVMAKYGPKLKVVSATNHPSNASGLVYDISPQLDHSRMITAPLLAERKKAGLKTTFYVCTNPKRPNTFTHSPLEESEWLGMYAAVHDLDGFLRWAYNSWNRNPFESTDFGNWPTGDCYLVYPGNLSSLRFEKLRDGIEEFEKMQALRAKAAKDPAFKKKLDAFITSLLPLFDKMKPTQLKYQEGVDAYHAGMKKLQKEL